MLTLDMLAGVYNLQNVKGLQLFWITLDLHCRTHFRFWVFLWHQSNRYHSIQSFLLVLEPLQEKFSQSSSPWESKLAMFQ